MHSNEMMLLRKYRINSSEQIDLTNLSRASLDLSTSDYFSFLLWRSTM